jgi:putative addiction module CopG family antidote
MSVDIPSNYTSMVQGLVSQGLYGTESEVVAEGLRLVSVKEQLRRDVAQGVEELDAGSRVAAEEVYQAARDRIRTIAQEGTR